MDWLDVIQARETTFIWRDEIPAQELILDVLSEVHENIFSKNLMFPWQVRLMRNDDPAIRKEIMTICHRNSTRPIATDPGNPQMMAPWLLGFSTRWVTDLEKRFDPAMDRAKLDGFGINKKRSQKTGAGKGQTQSENIEIGITAAYITLAMANRGIQTGVCQNICANYDRAAEIFKLDEDPRAMEFRFIMGVGYGVPHSEGPHMYLDPRDDIEKPVPYARFKSSDERYGRPDFNDIFKVVK